MSSAGPSHRPVLIVQHAPHEHPAALRRALESQGIPIKIARMDAGDRLPHSSEIAGLISLGGFMGANDEADYPWILDEIKLMKGAFDRGLPIFGICLGGQLLARALGGKVTRNPHPEIGWFPIHFNEEGLQDPILRAAGQDPLFYQWHYDTFFPPEGAEILAGSRLCPRQAYRINERTYGVQFHPEADLQMIEEWLAVEGTDEEILMARTAHHQECVQTPDEHVRLAYEEEIHSLSFIAAISQLFELKKYEDVTSSLREQARDLERSRDRVSIEIQGADPNAHPIIGVVVHHIEIPQGEFIIVRDAESLMWPVRLDHVRAIRRV